jgi:hypothetical protein
MILTWAFVRHGWSKSRTIYVAASPLPAIIVALCIYVFVHAATASKASCGVDACGMAMAAAVGLSSAAMVLYLFGLVVAWVMTRFSGRLKRDDKQDPAQ